MECTKLTNPPLVEAIFEIKWELQQNSINFPPIEPHYQILIGSLYEKIKDQYPFHEQLSSVMMPSDMAAYVIQHRFRKSENQWPLIQLGPGILTLNETERYSWTDFFSRTKGVLEKFYESYPETDKIKIKNLKLRYLDVIDFDYKDNILVFLEQKMGIQLNMPETLFEDTNVHNLPIAFDIRLTYPNCDLGNATIRLTRGEKNKKEAIILETNIETDAAHIPEDRDQIIRWIDKSHVLCRQWFQKLCEGELLEMFK